MNSKPATGIALSFCLLLGAFFPASSWGQSPRGMHWPRTELNQRQQPSRGVYRRIPRRQMPVRAVSPRTQLPRGRNYYQGRYFGNYNNRFYGPQYGYF